MVSINASHPDLASSQKSLKPLIIAAPVTNSLFVDAFRLGVSLNPDPLTLQIRYICICLILATRKGFDRGFRGSASVCEREMSSQIKI